MPDGNMRRPPQLWEQRLTRKTSVLGVGVSGSDSTSVVPPTQPPGSGGGTEPAPVTPPPATFIKPSTPQLIGGLQGINVLWDGLNVNGDLWPYDTSWVEVHMATTGTGFTPGTATLKGRLARPGSYFVGGLTAGSPYYFKFRGADPYGNYTEPSDAATGYTGLTTASDYGVASIGTGSVSFNARTIGGVTNTVGSVAPTSPIAGDVWLDSSPGTAIIHKIYNGSTWVTNAWGSASIAAGQVTAVQIAAGAVTAGAIAAGAVTTDKLTAGTITGFRINGGTISGGYISGGTMVSGVLDSASIRTAGTGARVEIGNAYGYLSSVAIYGSSGLVGSFGNDLGAGVALAAASGKTVLLNGTSIEVAAPMNCASSLNVDGQTALGLTSGAQTGLRVTGAGLVYSYGIDENTSPNAANVRVGANAQLLKSTSTVRLKDQLAPLDDDLAGVPADKLATSPASVDPYDVLDVVPTEFSSLCPVDFGEHFFGFIAEDVAAKYPWAAEWDEDGIPSSVTDRPILAALLAVVKDQQATITDLTARIEALEA